MATDFEIKQKIIAFLRSHEQGSSASDIAKHISHNRITIGKYLQVLEAEKLVVSRKVASAIFWQLASYAAKPKVLIVDDEKVIVDLIRLSLTPGRYDVSEAYDGEEALQKAFVLIPDVIVLDIMMPKKNGYEVCKELKAQASTQNTLIIVVSAKGQADDKIAMMQLGADDYITKPFDPFELEARIANLLRKKQLSTSKHPVTHLPDAFVTEEMRSLWSHQHKKWYELRIVLNNFEGHILSLGHRRANDILRLFVRFVLERTQALIPQPYIGHISDIELVVFSTVPVKELEKSLKQHMKDLLSFTYADLVVEKGQVSSAGNKTPVLLLVCSEVLHG